MHLKRHIKQQIQDKQVTPWYEFARVQGQEGAQECVRESSPSSTSFGFKRPPLLFNSRAAYTIGMMDMYDCKSSSGFIYGVLTTNLDGVNSMFAEPYKRWLNSISVCASLYRHRSDVGFCRRLIGVETPNAFNNTNVMSIAMPTRAITSKMRAAEPSTCKNARLFKRFTMQRMTAVSVTCATVAFADQNPTIFRAAFRA